MAELIHAKNLSWRHLHLLEDPFFARADVESAVRMHKTPGMAPNRGITNFQNWIGWTRLPLNDLNHAVLNSLNNGASYYVHHNADKPTRPLVFWKPAKSSKHSYLGENGDWEIHKYVPAPLSNKLRILLKEIEPSKPMTVYSIPEEVIAHSVPVSYISLNERHMFELEVEGENDTPIPENKKITLVGFNKKQNTVPVEEDKKLEQEVYSQIFRAKQGDHFEVFVIPERMKVVKQDLKDNRNLQKSVLEKSISPLKIVDTYTRADNVMVHVAKYVVPENHVLVINYEYGKHNSKPKDDVLVLVHEDSDWKQVLHIGDNNDLGEVDYDEDGWVKLAFHDIPKTGKFSLYNECKTSSASPVTMFSELSKSDLLEKPTYTPETSAPVDEKPEDLAALGETLEWEEWLESMAAS
ncbi:MAG: hypothetical protein ACI9OH_002757 [Oleispira sp.]|jgi:hypothetical protein